MAAIILQDPAGCARFTIMELARKARTSKTTVLRLCRRLNLESYRDLRLLLARETANAPDVHSYGINERDDPRAIIAKVRDKEIAAVQATLERLDVPTVVRVAETLLAARQVIMVACGGSLATAFDAHHKMLRLGLNCHLSQDQREQKFLAALCRPGDVVWAFSFSGASKEIVATLKIARAAGARIISLTNRTNSPIAKMSDLCLWGATTDLSEFTGTMDSRLSQLCVIDSLFLLMIKLGLSRVDGPMRTTEEIIRGDCLSWKNRACE